MAKGVPLGIKAIRFWAAKRLASNKPMRSRSHNSTRILKCRTNDDLDQLGSRSSFVTGGAERARHYRVVKFVDACWKPLKNTFTV